MLWSINDRPLLIGWFNKLASATALVLFPRSPGTDDAAMFCGWFIMAVDITMDPAVRPTVSLVTLKKLRTSASFRP